MIIDAHAHVSPTSYGSTESYLELLQRSGIRRGVVCPGSMLDVRRMSDYLFGKARPDPVPKNDYVERAVQAHPELYGLVCVDPDDQSAPQVLEQHLKRGFRGLRISPLVHRFSFSGGGVATLAVLCGEHRVPLYSHGSFQPGTTTAEFIQLARQFPKTNFILEHMGVGPADPEATEAAARLDNLFLDTSLGSYLHILETVKRAGASKLLFGSEFPLSHPGAELQKILLLPLSEHEREQVLAGNARELLRLG